MLVHIDLSSRPDLMEAIHNVYDLPSIESLYATIYKAHALPCLSNEHDHDHPPRHRNPHRTRGASLAWCEVAAGSIGVE